LLLLDSNREGERETEKREKLEKEEKPREIESSRDFFLLFAIISLRTASGCYPEKSTEEEEKIGRKQREKT
jgi:hypothetical protein